MRIGPVSPRTWRRWNELSGIFNQPTDPDWADERNLLDDGIADPWAER